MSTAPARPPARGHRFPLMDALRATAALSVFVYHVAFNLDLFSGHALSGYFAQLNVGVVIFFLLSGFLLYRPFAAARLAGGPGPRLGVYATRRTLRIVPAYWVALTLIALWLGLSYVFTPRGIITYFGFLQLYDADTVTGGIGQAWTLGVEVAFYALLPLLGLLMRRVPFRGARGFLLTELALLASLYAVAVAWQIVVVEVIGSGSGAYFPALIALPAQLDQFALGMGLAVATVALAARGAGRRAPGAVRLVERAPWAAWVLAAAAFVLVAEQVRPFGDGQLSAVLTEHGLKGIVALGLLLPAAFGDQLRDPIRRVLAWRPLAWVGLVSYGFYLWHLAILDKLQEAGVDDALGGLGYAIVGLAASLAVAAASWYGLERPVLRIAHRRSLRPGRRPGAAAEEEPMASGLAGADSLPESAGSPPTARRLA